MQSKYVFRALFVALLVAVDFGSPRSALAVTVDFQTTGTGYDGFGTLSGTPDPSIASTIDLTGGSFTLNGTEYNLLTPGGTSSSPVFSGEYNYDNILYTDPIASPSGLPLDIYGLVFTTGPKQVNIYASLSGSGYTGSTFDGTTRVDQAATFAYADATAVPLPKSATVGLILLGLIASSKIFVKRAAA